MSMKYVRWSDLSDAQKGIASCKKYEYIVPRACGASTAIISAAIDRCIMGDDQRVCVVGSSVDIEKYCEVVDTRKDIDFFIRPNGCDQCIIFFFKNGSILVLSELCGSYGITFTGNDLKNPEHWEAIKYIEFGLFYDYIYFDSVLPYDIYKGSKEYLFDTLKYYVKHGFTFVHNNLKFTYYLNSVVAIKDKCLYDDLDWFSRNVNLLPNDIIKDYKYLYQYGKAIKVGTVGKVLCKDKDGVCLFQDEYGNVWLIYEDGLTYIN